MGNFVGGAGERREKDSKERKSSRPICFIPLATDLSVSFSFRFTNLKVDPWVLKLRNYFLRMKDQSGVDHGQYRVELMCAI